jgi:hypothetical protein
MEGKTRETVNEDQCRCASQMLAECHRDDRDMEGVYIRENEKSFTH